jgi:hypothetical protein
MPEELSTEETPKSTQPSTAARLSPEDLERRASEAFFKDLKDFLYGHPYWVKVLGSGNRRSRKVLAQRIAKVLSTIPTVAPSGMPNRETRKAIIKSLNSSSQ